MDVVQTDTNPEDGISLTFNTNPNGAFRPVQIPGVNLGGLGVPIEGVSWNNNMYLYASNAGMVNTVLAKSTDNGFTFTKLYDFSNSKFINVNVIKIKSTAAYPEPLNTDIQVMLGSGQYRASNVFLAYQRGDQIEQRNVKFFKGLVNGNPTWSANEADAVPLFNQPCVGELSVSYNNFIKKWILLYNCGSPRGINCRTADQPWGPWSDPFVIFDPAETVDKGYCYFMHTSWDVKNCDNVHDTGREREWGGEYGPYQFEDLATGSGLETTIYYTLSTWNPYTTVLMKSTLRKKEPIKPGVYRVMVRHSNKAMDNSGFPGSGVRNIVQFDWLDNVYQKWQFDLVDNGYYKITSIHSGEVLDLAGCSNANGAAIQQWPSVNNDCQKWRIEDLGGGYYRFISKASGKVIEVNGSSANGGRVQQWDWNGQPWQQWRIEPAITSGLYSVTAKHSNKVLDNGGFPGSGNRNVVQWEWYNNPIQHWQFDPVGNGYYRITSRQSSEVLDLAGCGIANGTNIQQWPWSDNDCQKWRLEYLDGGYFRIVSKATGKVVEVNGSPDNGGNVQQWEWNGYDWQRWKLDRLNSDGTFARERTLNEITEAETIEESGLKLYPIPAVKNFVVEFVNKNTGAGSIELHDPQSKEVSRSEISVTEGINAHEVITSGLPPGVYFVKIRLPGKAGAIRKKILITN
ncbi:RICIN domain-containing protein [uncultured Arthrobacter sp.]|uniref:RICIN domain-containing protein n=1 Tax=uncultured Arthrobacter sp. TaxID=114050 RepID=UPI0032169C94